MAKKRNASTQLIPAIFLALCLLILGLGIISLSLKLLSRPTSPSAQAAGSSNTQIVFISQRDSNNREIYSINTDGTNLKRLTFTPAAETDPSITPDGRILYASNPNSNYDIFIMNLDGTNKIQLTTDPNQDVIPVMSPDKTKIAFVSDRDGNDEIFIMNNSGANQKKLTKTSLVDVNKDPSFSPNSKKIVFSAARVSPNYYDSIYIMNLDGTGQKRISSLSYNFIHPVYSPDGSHIIFSGSGDSNPGIYRMKLDGTGLKPLSATKDLNPSYSLNGKLITFYSSRSNGETAGYDIYVMNSDGTNSRNLTKATNIGLGNITDIYPSF